VTLPKKVIPPVKKKKGPFQNGITQKGGRSERAGRSRPPCLISGRQFRREKMPKGGGGGGKKKKAANSIRISPEQFRGQNGQSVLKEREREGTIKGKKTARERGVGKSNPTKMSPC